MTAIDRIIAATGPAKGAELIAHIAVGSARLADKASDAQLSRLVDEAIAHPNGIKGFTPAEVMTQIRTWGFSYSKGTDMVFILHRNSRTERLEITFGWQKSA